MDLLALQCLSRDSRDSGESREVVLAKKELHVSEERIKDLEEAMRSRAEVQALMEAEQQQMLRQLEEARTVLLERKRRRQARSAARRDMKEQRAAKLLAEEQTEQRRKAALERKATLDAEIAARADVRQAKAAHAAAAQAEALAATAAAAAATAAEQAEAAANHQVEAAAASAAAAVEVEAAATRSANDEHETAQLLRMQAELDAATAVLEDETAAAVEAAFTAAATAVAATETMPAPTASELAPEGPGREPPLHATSEMDSWSESHPGVAAAAIADTAAAVTEAEPEPEAVSAAVEVAPGGPHGQEAPLHVTMSEVDSHPDRGLTSDRTPVPGLAPDPEPHAGAEQPAEQLQNLGAPPEAGVEAGAAEADARAEEAAGGGAGGAEGFLSEGEQEAPVKEVVAVDEAEVGPGTPPEGVPSSAVGAAAAEEGQEDAELAAALLELQLSPRQETGAAPPEGDSAAAALPLGSMDGAQLDAELQPQSAAPTPRPSTEGEQRRLEACAQSEAALSTAQSAARKAEVERQRVAAELEQHKRAQDEAGRSKPKGGLRSVLGFNKKRAKAAQELSAARTAELGSRLEQLKLEAEAAAEAETRVEDEHRQVQERLTLERKGSLARARAAADQAAEVAAAQAAEVSALEGQDAGTDAGADASADAGADAGAGELAGAMQTAEAPPLPEAAHGNNVPAEESADAGDEETEDESEDSDFLHSAREPPAAPLLKGLVNMAKLYGYEDSLPSNFDLERELRWLMLTPDALWHADEASGALDVEEGELGWIDLSQIKSCHLSEDGLELVIAGEGKCHLLSSASRSSVDLAQWHRAIQDELGKSQLDA